MPFGGALRDDVEVDDILVLTRSQIRLVKLDDAGFLSGAHDDRGALIKRICLVGNIAVNDRIDQLDVGGDRVKEQNVVANGCRAEVVAYPGGRRENAALGHALGVAVLHDSDERET